MMAMPTDLLRAMFTEAVAAVATNLCLPPHLPTSPPGRTIFVGAGKASAAMAAALEVHWPGRLTGLVVTRYGHAAPCRHIEIVEAAHPVPDIARIMQQRRLSLIRNGGASTFGCAHTTLRGHGRWPLKAGVSSG
jgi:hydroxypyruvate reductase